MAHRKHDYGKVSPAQAGRGIYMWEIMEKSGKSYFVPLGQDLKAMADIAVEDAPESTSSEEPEAESLVLVPGVMGSAKAADTQIEAPQKFIATVLETVLRDSPRTTYQVYEALILRLISADAVGTLSPMSRLGVSFRR